MVIHFANKEHEERYSALLERDGTREGDGERESFFYLISFDLKLFKDIDKFYDFSIRRPRIRYFDKNLWDEQIEKGKYKDYQKLILKLAMCFLADWCMDGLGPFQVFHMWLEGENIVLLTAFAIRFNMEYGVSLMADIEVDYYDHYLLF